MAEIVKKILKAILTPFKTIGDLIKKIKKIFSKTPQRPQDRDSFNDILDEVALRNQSMRIFEENGVESVIKQQQKQLLQLCIKECAKAYNISLEEMQEIVRKSYMQLQQEREIQQTQISIDFEINPQESGETTHRNFNNIDIYEDNESNFRQLLLQSQREQNDGTNSQNDLEQRGSKIEETKHKNFIQSKQTEELKFELTNRTRRFEVKYQNCSVNQTYKGSMSSTKDLQNEQIKPFLCSLSKCLMEDPVMSRYGNFFDRYAIERYIYEHGTCPVTKQKLTVEDIFPAIDLKNRIDEFKRQNSRNIC